MPMVETSVAVATPSTTAVRMMIGSASAGSATISALPMSVRLVFFTPLMSSWRVWYRTTAPISSKPTKAGIRPPTNKAVIDTPVTDPTVINTMLGGMVADMADQADQEIDHGACQARHLDQCAQKHKQGHGQQDQVRHALLHATGHDRQWGTG